MRVLLPKPLKGGGIRMALETHLATEVWWSALSVALPSKGSREGSDGNFPIGPVGAGDPIMPRTITAADRSAVIRRAASLPKGSPERRTLLSSLQRDKVAAWSFKLSPEATLNETKAQWAAEALKASFRAFGEGGMSMRPLDLNDAYAGGSYFIEPSRPIWIHVWADKGNWEAKEDRDKRVVAKGTFNAEISAGRLGDEIARQVLRGMDK